MEAGIATASNQRSRLIVALRRRLPCSPRYCGSILFIRYIHLDLVSILANLIATKKQYYKEERGMRFGECPDLDLESPK